MFEIGFSEILLISVIALVVLGPERLPKLAAQVGRWVGKARSMARQFREQLESEVNLDDLHRPSTPPPQNNSPSWPPSGSPAAADNTIHAQPDPAAPPPTADDFSHAHGPGGYADTASAPTPADAAATPSPTPVDGHAAASPAPAWDPPIHPEAEAYGHVSPTPPAPAAAAADPAPAAGTPHEPRA